MRLTGSKGDTLTVCGVPLDVVAHAQPHAVSVRVDGGAEKVEVTTNLVRSTGQGEAGLVVVPIPDGHLITVQPGTIERQLYPFRRRHIKAFRRRGGRAGA